MDLKLDRKARTALNELWRMARDKEAPRAERIKLLQFFVELGIGKPVGMERAGRVNSSEGVVILPEAAFAAFENEEEAQKDEQLTV